ncbi:MAG: hypothetical protein Q9217_000720 [Psora testacea]
MSSSGSDPGQLTESQQLALGTYTSVTNQEPSAAIPLLQRSEWNVQIAIAKFFDGETPDPVAQAHEALHSRAATQSSRRETLLNGSPSFQTSPNSPTREHAPRIVPRPESQWSYTPPLPFRILLTPFNVLTRFVGGSFSLIGYLLSVVPRLLPGVFDRHSQPRIRSGRRPLGPRDTAARFAREFEEDYGTHNLHLFEGGYAQAYDLAKKDLRFLLVVLISPEHDDTSMFVRETLLSPEVTEYVNEHQDDMILWAGNVQDSEAYQVSTALNCSKFPFAALLVHTPHDSSTSMSTIARITGLDPPSVFIAQLRKAIDQHTPALTRARAQRSEQQASRNLREEQNSAYERSLAQDRERARHRREAEAARARAAEEAQAKAAAAQKEAQMVEQWRKWRAQKLAPEPGPDVKDVTRLSIRMSSGERIVRKFPSQADLEELYAFIECHHLLQSDEQSATARPEAYEHTYRFRLVAPMPRTVYEVTTGGTIGSRIGRSGNLIVEPIDDAEDND